MRYLGQGMVALMLLGLATEGWCGSGAYNREIRYPTRFVARPGPNGVALVPTDFTTRKTGPTLQVEQVGIAQNVMVDGRPGVRLRMRDGRTLVTRTGKLVKLDGVIYRTEGWRDGQYLLVSTRGKRHTIAFTTPE